MPTFRYHLQAGTDDRLDVSERIERAAQRGGGRAWPGISPLQVPARQNAPGCWPASAPANHALLDAKGAVLPLDLKSGSAETPAAGKAVVLPQDGDHVDRPDAGRRAGRGGVARAEGRRRAGRCSSAFRLAPRRRSPGGPDVWAPYRNEPELIKELLSAR